MSESIPKEIIGIAQASEWNNIKAFIKALLEMTLDKDEEYSLIALNASVNNKKLKEYDTQIKTKDQIKIINNIDDFEILRKDKRYPVAKIDKMLGLLPESIKTQLRSKTGNLWFQLPLDLREIARLNKEVVLVGELKRFEIWEKDRWEEEFQLARENFPDVSQSLSELGI